jgi:hypothetical protein
MSRDSQQDPKTARIWRRSAPIPRNAIVSEEVGVVKTSLRRARNGRGLDNPNLLAKTKHTEKGEWELVTWGAACPRHARKGLPSVGTWALRNGPKLFKIFIELSLDRDGPSHRRKQRAQSPEVSPSLPRRAGELWCSG